MIMNCVYSKFILQTMIEDSVKKFLLSTVSMRKIVIAIEGHFR